MNLSKIVFLSFTVIFFNGFSQNKKEINSDASGKQPAINKPELVYDLYLKSIDNIKKDEILNAYFTDAFHDRNPSYKHLERNECNKYFLENIYREHRSAQLNYSVSSTCNVDQDARLRKIRLKKERKKGWLIDNISESVYLSKDTRPAYEEEYKYIFADSSTSTIFCDYLKKVNDGDAWEVYKNFHTSSFIANTEHLIKNVTEKKRKVNHDLGTDFLSCTDFESLMNNTKGETHIAVYKHADYCRKKDKKYYSKVVYKYSNESWKIDKITLSIDNNFK